MDRRKIHCFFSSREGDRAEAGGESSGMSWAAVSNVFNQNLLKFQLTTNIGHPSGLKKQCSAGQGIKYPDNRHT